MNERKTVSKVDVKPEELEAALAHIAAGKPIRLRITTVPDLLKAVELGVVDKSEARRSLGFAPTRGKAAARQPRTGGKFAKS